MPRPTFATAALLLAWCVACAGDRPPGRVLLVGIDGATLRVALPMLKDGSLPHLARIASEGVFGPLRSHLPLLSPRIWNSIATGKAPENHGIGTFSRPAEDGSRRLYQSGDRKTHALWNIASDAGLTVGVVNWWTTYPPEKVNGVMVSDHMLPHEIAGRAKLAKAPGERRGAFAHPVEWVNRVETLLADDERLVDVEDPFAHPERFARWMEAESLSKRARADESIVRIALEVESELRPDVLLVFLPGIDRVSHRLWATIEPPEAYENPLPMTESERSAGAEGLRGYYRFTDALIGRLLERYGPDDLVLVVSDHGIEAGEHLLTLTGVHKGPKALNGVIFARGPDIAEPEDRRPVSVNDVTPTILAWLGLPLGEDMDGRVAPFLDVRDVATIPTHDTTPIERVADAPSGAEEAILEQLEALGYLEPGASD